MATLYTFHLSVWCAAAELAVGELGLTDKITKKSIDVVNAENLSPDYFKINPSATVPALSAEGTVYTNTTDVVDYLVKIAPVKVAPRTEFTKVAHDDAHEPNFLFVGVRNEADATAKAAGFPKILIETRATNAKTFLPLPEAAPFKETLEKRIQGMEGLLSVYNGTAPAEVKAHIFAASQANFDATRKFLYETLPAALGAGPFLAGATPGEDDFHVACLLFHAGACAGAAKASDGLAAFEKWFGAPVDPKVVALWDAWTSRESWKAVYPDGALH